MTWSTCIAPTRLYFGQTSPPCGERQLFVSFSARRWIPAWGEVELEPLRVEVFGDLAYEAGRCKMLVPVAVNKRREERGKYLVIFARQAGDWKAIADCCPAT